MIIFIFYFYFSHIYGGHHFNQYSWKEVQKVIQSVDDPIICLELTFQNYELLLSRTMLFGINPEEILKKATKVDLKKYNFVNSSMHKNTNK